MSGLSAPGSKRFKAKDLTEFIMGCHNCQDGWIHVAYGFQENKWDVYKFPCVCSGSPNGKYWYQCDNPDLYANMQPDYQATPRELPGYVFIHPSHKRGFEKILKRLHQTMARIRAEQGDELPF